MFSTIVVGTDGSQTAKRAVTVAATVARQFGARLHVVNGYNDPAGVLGLSTSASRGSVTATSVVTRWRRASDAVLAEAVTDPVMAGVEVQAHSVPGAPAQAVVDVATEVGADLVVIGNRGIRGDGSSVPDAVARHAPCHVLVAKTT